jgi:prevent-host-death family protein
MPRTWQLQDAKNHFSEVVNRALDEGPQTVTRHGREAVVVISAEEYRRLRMGQRGFKAFLKAAPLDGVALDRDEDPGREVELP